MPTPQPNGQQPMTKYYPGHQFGNLTLVSIDRQSYRATVTCGLCDNIAQFQMSALISGRNRDCGCTKTSVIYFIKVNEYVKIGRCKTTTVARRLESIQTGSPYNVELIRTMVGDWSTERSLHKLYEPFHHRGEWFTYTDSMSTITSEDLK